MSAKLRFSSGEVARLTGIKFRTLDHWATTGLLCPSIEEAEGTGTRRVYSLSDVVAGRAARELRAAGMPTRTVRIAVKAIRTALGADLAGTWLVISGAGGVSLVGDIGELSGLIFTVLNLGRIVLELGLGNVG